MENLVHHWGFDIDPVIIIAPLNTGTLLATRNVEMPPDYLEEDFIKEIEMRFLKRQRIEAEGVQFEADSDDWPEGIYARVEKGERKYFFREDLYLRPTTDRCWVVDKGDYTVCYTDEDMNDIYERAD